MLLGQMPERIDWSKLADYEKEDTTVSMQTMACTGDSCELVDISA
jgi:ribonucleoside-diphosphate reductase alpha chain